MVEQHDGDGYGVEEGEHAGKGLGQRLPLRRAMVRRAMVRRVIGGLLQEGADHVAILASALWVLGRPQSARMDDVPHPAVAPSWCHRLVVLPDREVAAGVSAWLTPTGEVPVVALLTRATLREVVGASSVPPGVRVLDHPDDIRPAALLQRLDRVIGKVGRGPLRVVVDHAVPYEAALADAWWRLEAYLEEAYGRSGPDRPLELVCLHHRHRVPPVHAPWLRACHHADGDSALRPVLDPLVAVSTLGLVPTLPLEWDEPRVVMTDPEPHAVRMVTRGVAAAAGLGADPAERLVLAVDELVTNAGRHGTPSVHVEVRARRREVLVSVRDTGLGPMDRFAGLRPASGEVGGRGLWVAGLAAHVFHRTLAAGHTAIAYQRD